jgi:hypothetical protein
VLYEHFYTEHLRGHHVRVGTPADPATARFGESFETFFRRTVPAQFRSAWRIENRRLGDVDLPIWDRRMLRHRVLHGLVVEWALAIGIFVGFGFAAFVAFVLQAFAAIRLLEVVNYFEHWGLRRAERRVRPVDSWDTHSWFTYYGLIGLSRHADHHAEPARPYTQLRVFEEAPLLAYGYVGMVDLVLMDDAAFHESATLELARRRLGPFATAGAASEVPSEEAARERLAAAQAAESPPREPNRLARAVHSVPARARRVLALGALVLGTSLAVHWETAGAQMTFLARVGLCAWTLAAFALVISIRERIEARTNQETFSWAVALALLVAFGHIAQNVFA